MAEHRVSITVAAPVHQVYAVFTRFTDYPKIMSYVKDVSFIDAQTTKWVVDIAGRHAWTAVNEDWVPDRQIGWRSTEGFPNSGRVAFQAIGADRTQIDVTIAYDPPAGPIGTVGELLGIGSTFESALRNDLAAFAAAVEAIPDGALNPNSSAYLFNPNRTTTGDSTIVDDDAPVVPGTSRASRTIL